jgi:hypothetical protein
MCKTGMVGFAYPRTIPLDYFFAHDSHDISQIIGFDKEILCKWLHKLERPHHAKPTQNAYL